MIVILIMLVVLVLLGAITLSIQVYKLTELDAQCRGLKHPKFWGLFSMSGNNGCGGLILYLIGRRKYPITMTEVEIQNMNRYKKRALVALCSITIATIALLVVCIWGNI